MALRTIGDDSKSSNDLPWANEYLQQGGSANDATFVRNLKISENGILVLGEDFKGFLFRKSAISKFLLEALDAWVTNQVISYPLYMVAAKSGKISLAVEDEEQPTIWLEETKDKSYEQKRKKDRAGSIALAPSNPFLPSTPPPTRKRKKAPSDVEHPDYNAMPY